METIPYEFPHAFSEVSRPFSGHCSISTLPKKVRKLKITNSPIGKCGLTFNGVNFLSNRHASKKKLRRFKFQNTKFPFILPLLIENETRGMLRASKYKINSTNATKDILHSNC